MRVSSNRAASYGSGATGYAGATNTGYWVSKLKDERVIPIGSAAATFNRVGVAKIDIECRAALQFSRNDVDQAHRQNRLVAQHSNGCFNQMRSHNFRFAIAVEISGCDKCWIVISGPTEWPRNIVCPDDRCDERAIALTQYHRDAVVIKSVDRDVEFAVTI